MENSETTKGGPTPFPQALVLCDSVIVEAGTEKITLVGIFARVQARVFPTQYQMAIYARLKEAQGLYDFRIDYVQIKTDKVLAQVSLKSINIPDRSEVRELVVNPPPRPIPEPGEYEFRLWANDRYVGSIKFTALDAARRKGG